MENPSNHHPTAMKRYFLAFLLIISFDGFGIAQDTLKEENSVMYSKYYVLHDDDRFEYFFHHCTGVSYGQGKMNRRLFKWEFEFDSLSAPSVSYSCSNISLTDSIRFEFRSSLDSSEIIPYDITINKKKYFIFDPELTIARSAISEDPIQLVIGQDSLKISEKITNYSLATIYLSDGWKTYINGGTDYFVKKHGALYLVQEVDVNSLSEYYKKKARRGKLYYRYKKI